MRFAAKTGFAIGLASLIITEHAFSKSGDPPRFTDPDLIALEKLGTRAKKAMEAFVLRPRLPDSYNFVCSGCLVDENKAVLHRIAKAPTRTLPEEMIVASYDTSQTIKSRYVSLQAKRVRRAIAAKRLASTRRRPIKRAAQVRSDSYNTQSWDDELRR